MKYDLDLPTVVAYQKWWDSAAAVLDMTVMGWTFKEYATFVYADENGQQRTHGVDGRMADRLIKVGEELGQARLANEMVKLAGEHRDLAETEAGLFQREAALFQREIEKLRDQLGEAEDERRALQGQLTKTECERNRLWSEAQRGDLP